MPAIPPELKAIFCEALDRPSDDERRAYLDRACAGDTDLRARIDALLLAHHDVGAFLEQPLPTPGATWDAPSPLETPGTIIGPYKLLQQIGEGGMGAVYMAEQQEPVRRKVALKVIKPGMDSRQVIARFEAERQALAMMDHQNIARVLDAGTTESGRPYFVMELVHGVPITQFCDDRKLTLRQRLELLIPVCQAIQHAHQKGIIHRDIKPSNVLVTMYDDKPVPKVIDFGVAKAIEQRLTEKTLFTQFGALVGTFEYMSPEQAEMNAFGVDTRSDIYALGVLLYELLTGTTPLGQERLRQAALDELLRLIKEEETPRPSARLSSSQNLPKLAAARNTDPGRLSGIVRGELDWIVMKCLEKDRTRRYESASGLARDIQRYLADEPVEACPPGAGYRLGKIARRYRTALVTAAAFVLLLVAGATLSTVLAVRATRAEHEARRQRIASEAAREAAVEAEAEAAAERDAAHLAAYASGMGLAQRAWDENNVDRARELLLEVPHEVGGRDLRGFEWRYLSRLCQPAPLTLNGHTRIVSHVQFSPDGRRLASSSWDKTVKVWDAAIGREVLSIDTGGRWCVAFSPDGRRLVSGSRDHTLKIWDAASGKELASLAGHSDEVSSVAYSPDGRRIAAGAGDTVKVWDVETGRELITFEGHVMLVCSLTFSPDGRRLAAGSEVGTLKLWDAQTGKELLAFEAVHQSTTAEVAFSPDGRRLVSEGGDNTIKIWDSTTGKELLALKGHTKRAYTAAFSPDGRCVASGSADNSVKIWDAATGRELTTLRGHTSLITSLAWSPDGWRVASASLDGTIKIWDAAAGPDVATFKGHDSWLGGIAFSPDGRRLAAEVGANFGFSTRGFAAKVWDVATGKELSTLTGHESFIVATAFSPDGVRLTTVADRIANRRLAEPSEDRTVKVWDVANGKNLSSLDIHTGQLSAIVFSPGADRLAGGGRDGVVKIWDVASGRQVGSFEGRTHPVDLVFSPDGRRLASGGRDGTLKVWDATTGQEILSVKGHSSSDGRDTFIGRVAYSPDGRRLATAASDTTVKIWDAATGRELLTLKGHAGRVDGVAYSPDGRRIASGGRDGKVRLWDAATGKEVSALNGYSGGLSFVAFSPDGQRLAASANGDGSVKVWEADVLPEDLERRAAQQVVDDLFRQLGLRDDVLAHLATATGLSPPRQRAALDSARVHREDAAALNDLAWELAKSPGRDEADYRRAVRCAEQAGQLEPEKADFLTTLGVAYYRAGTIEKAAETFERSSRLRSAEGGSPAPADLAFLAMAQRRLGHPQEARTSLDRLRERLKDPRPALGAEAQGFLREAESLVAPERPPAGP